MYIVQQVSPLIKKIIEFVKLNWRFLLIGLAVLAGIIWILIQVFNKPKEELFYYELPLNYYRSFTFTTNEDLKNDDTISLSTHMIKEETKTPVVETFISKTGLSDLKKTTVSPTLYKWTSTKNEISLETDFEIMKFSISGGIQPIGSTSFITKDTVGQYATNFIKNYFNPNWETTNLDITQSGSTYIVKGFRVLNGLPLGSLYLGTNGFELKINQNGKVTSGAVLLSSFEESATERLVSLSTKQVASYISSDSYPKYIIYETDKSSYFSKSDPYGFTTTKIKTYTIDSIKPVLIVSTPRYKYALPMYLLEGEGTLGTIKVPVKVLTNILPLNRVYLPSERYYIN